jgi:tyrosine-protein kinase Etk/Wzc
VQLRTELQALQNERRAEIQLIVSSLRREIEILRSREAALEAEIKGVGGRDGRDEPAAGADPLRSEQKLEGELAQLQERLVQLEAQAAGSLPSARIIEPAIAPDQPVRPRTAMIYGVALAGGVLLGGLVGFALESVRRTRA